HPAMAPEYVVGLPPSANGPQPRRETQALPEPQALPPLPGLVSVLVPCCGPLEYTRLCVRNLLRHSAAPCELLFLDIASLDGTAAYLLGLADAAPLRVEVVRNLTDLGIAAAVRQALARARGDYLVLLNNDVLVTDGWLNQLVALANLAPEIGL